MKIIYKYILPKEARFTLDLPIGAQVLTVQLQQTLPVMWVLVNPEGRFFQTRYFSVKGTGTPITDEKQILYINTWQDGQHVWHLFEIL